MGERRNLKVYETSDKKYIPTPTIILKGKWLKRYGFDNNKLVSVDCDNGRIVIEPREPDPVVIDSVIDGFWQHYPRSNLCP